MSTGCWHTDYWALHCNSPLTAWAGMFTLDGATWEGYVRCSDSLLVIHPCQSLLPDLGSTSGAGLSRECRPVPCTTLAHRDSAHVPLPGHLINFLHSKASTLKTPPFIQNTAQEHITSPPIVQLWLCWKICRKTQMSVQTQPAALFCMLRIRCCAKRFA